MAWICANCGAEHASNDPPCRKCAHEQFARLDNNQSVQRVESTVDILWRCKQCGQIHRKNSPPCDSCGAMVFESVESLKLDETGGDVPEASNSRMITGWLLLQYLIGIPLFLIGMVYSFGTVWGGLSMVGVAALTMPHSREFIQDRFNVRLSTGALLLLSLTLFTVGLYFVVLWNINN